MRNLKIIPILFLFIAFYSYEYINNTTRPEVSIDSSKKDTVNPKLKESTSSSIIKPTYIKKKKRCRQ